ncbi:MAG: DMT family transporter [Nevskiales bacterium]
MGKQALTCAVLAGALFATMGALVKLTTGRMPTEMAVFLRNLFGLAMLTPWMLRLGAPGLKTQRYGGHLVRAVFGLTAMYCFFYTFHHLPLAQAMLLNYSAPVFLPIIAYLWLKERPGAAVYPAALIGLAGVALVLNASTIGLSSVAGIVGLASGIFAALAMAGVRRITNTEPTSRIVFYLTLHGAVLSGIPMLWRWQNPTGLDVLIMLGAGVSATLGQLFLTRAYSLGSAAQIAPLTYTTVVFAAIWGWLLWDEALSSSFAFGALLIAIGGTLALRASPKPAPIPEELLPEELLDADLIHGRHGD